ncbi:hypothetical protein B9Z19DRAFT_279708 [Tuber borchii]|uniref:Secreted protein n=1 Tax=Tuber borchii TaxID=42251 RepID=A0A2T7A550_TUBBO|nr:hypothetical protein B9Z19DRAFT_279708 [Tuber borchii]
MKIPSWCVLHCLVVAEATLLLETVYQRASNVDGGIIDDMCQVVKWLHEISGNDMASMRTHEQLSKLLGWVLLIVGRDVGDLGVRKNKGGGLGKEEERAVGGRHRIQHSRAKADEG